MHVAAGLLYCSMVAGLLACPSRQFAPSRKPLAERSALYIYQYVKLNYSSNHSVCSSLATPRQTPPHPLELRFLARKKRKTAESKTTPYQNTGGTNHKNSRCRASQFAFHWSLLNDKADNSGVSALMMHSTQQ